MISSAILKHLSSGAADAQTASNKILAILLALLMVAGLAVLSNPLQRGLRAAYYDNPEWTDSPMLTAREQTFTLERVQHIFPPLTRNYSISWTGVIAIPAAGAYQFTTVSDDGSEIVLDDRRVVDNRGLHGVQERTGSVYLTKGFHAFTLRYMQGGGGAVCRAFWMRPGHKREPLSAAAFFAQAPTPIKLAFGNLLEIMRTGGLFFFISVCGVVGWRILQNCRPIPPFLKSAGMGAGIFLCVFLTHFVGSKIATPFDSKWTLYTALSIIQEGNTDLDEYQQIVKARLHDSIERIDGHLYSIYPVGTVLMAVPFVFVIETFLKNALNLDLANVIHGNLEICIAALLVALCAVLVYFISAVLVGNRPSALLLAFIFAFGTAAWSTASRALWQHGPSMLMLALALYLLLLTESRPTAAPWLIRLMSLALAFAFVIRPTNAIPLFAFTILIGIAHQKYFFSYMLWSLAIFVPFLLFNLTVYHAVLPPYYLPGSRPYYYIPPNQLDFVPRFVEALVGHCFSPARGLFIFSPVLLFSLYGMFVKTRQKTMTPLDYAIMTTLGLHWIAISLFPVWWAGHSYGPRYFSDMLPYFIYFLAPALKSIAALPRLKKRAMILVFSCAVVFSVLIHYRGATSWDVYLWNVAPTPVESKLWNWQDLQFLRGLK